MMNEDEVESEFQRLKKIYAEKKAKKQGESSDGHTTHSESPSMTSTSYLSRLRTASLEQHDCSPPPEHLPPQRAAEKKQNSARRLVGKLLGLGGDDHHKRGSSSNLRMSQTNEEMMDHLAAKVLTSGQDF
jgi:hypothetical protein